ncbi:MAG TPA: hypothetical protein VGQ52_18610 [Gemmatimonadaceae bacterium]|nr:hypothetical protein [Gemmatimonadaceae bacterium]
MRVGLDWWRHLWEPGEPPEKVAPKFAPPTIAIPLEEAAYSLVLVVAEDFMKSLVRDQAERRLLRTIAAQPPFPLTLNARIETLSVPVLPREDKAAVEAVVCALQTKYGRRGGDWQAEFYNKLGFAFMVLYLE